MKLLIVTQVVDTQHPVLGFFHRWIEEFASKYDTVIVICLEEGVHNFPQNVTVQSLGKEKKQSRLQYVLNFYRLIWVCRNEYDHVFVHMNQIYILMAGWLWRLWGKKVGLWYAHGAVSGSLRLAIPFTHQVFTSTKEGLQINTKKKVIVGQGIDATIFTRPEKLKDFSGPLQLITVGRISKSKNLSTLLHACALLKERGVDFTFHIVGSATTEEEQVHETEVKQQSAELSLENEVMWVGPVPQTSLPALLQSADIFIHDGATNSLDKTLLEALLCGCVVISSNPAYTSLAQAHTPELLFAPKDSIALANCVTLVHENTLATNKADNLRQFVKEQYSVGNLISGIVGQYKK